MGCTIVMPQDFYSAGDTCQCDLLVCNTFTYSLTNVPVFMVLELFGVYYFAPEFNDYSFYLHDILPGENTISVLPEFSWPSGVGQVDDATWYAAMTDPEISNTIGGVGVFTFGWDS